MKFISIVCLSIIFIVGIAEATLTYETGARVRNHPNMCRSNMHRMDMILDKTYHTPGDVCGKMYCTNSFAIHHHTCDQLRPDRRTSMCPIEENKALAYPECCPKHVCPPERWQYSRNRFV